MKVEEACGGLGPAEFNCFKRVMSESEFFM